MSTEILTAEQFAERLPDLPDGGRWVELEAGVVSVLDLSDAAHGTIVLNLSKRLAEYLAGRRDDPAGYACFELGLIVARNPDTVRRPAVSFFASAGLFAETDNAVTESVPELVVETATNNRIRRAIWDRIGDYHRHGVSTVWVADPVDKVVHVMPRASRSRAVSAGKRLSGDPLLPGFSLPVSELFAEPDWWSGRR
jgi:Uma2 family endonuclease